ncbi:MAG TPA: glycosyltransferase 87 family protein [Candidatus Limnocylindrales bacterium]
MPAALLAAPIPWGELALLVLVDAVIAAVAWRIVIGSARDSGALARVASLSAGGFVVAWAVVDILIAAGLYGPQANAWNLGPAPGFGDAVAAGQLPYRDFQLEYPPLSIVAFAAPALFRLGSAELSSYVIAFQALMLAFGIVVCFLVARTALQLGATRRQLATASAFVAASPILLGPVLLGRYDLWPTVLTAAALAAVVADRPAAGFAALGLGALAKVVPGLLLPLFAIHAWRRHGRDAAVRGVAVFAAVVGLGLLPFLLVAPEGTLRALVRFVQRPLEVEALGAALLVVAHNLVGLPIHPQAGFGSANLTGASASIVGLLQTIVLGLALLGIWTAFWRDHAGAPGTADRDARRLVLAAAATLAAYVAFSKVLSPQYLTWLVPVGALLAVGPGARRALGGLAVLLLLTCAVWPFVYTEYSRQHELGPALVVLARDLGLVVFAAYLLARLWRDRQAGDRQAGDRQAGDHGASDRQPWTSSPGQVSESR